MTSTTHKNPKIKNMSLGICFVFRKIILTSQLTFTKVRELIHLYFHTSNFYHNHLGINEKWNYI